MENKVSIIIPAYNCEKYIFECLESVINQTYSNLEIIIIDDGSTDNTSEICQRFEKIDNRIIYTWQENNGVSKARNKGIDLAKGKYIVFIDADDKVGKCYIEQFIYIFEHYDVQMASLGHSNSFEQIKDKISNEINIVDAKNARNKSMTFTQNIYNGYLWEKMFLADVIKNKVRFNEEILVREDLLFIIDYLFFIDKCGYTDNKLYYYRENADSVIHNMNSKRYYTQIKMAEKVMKLETKDSELYSAAEEAYYESARRYIEHLAQENSLMKMEKKWWLKKQVYYFLSKNRKIIQVKRIVSILLQRTI